MDFEDFVHVVSDQEEARQFLRRLDLLRSTPPGTTKQPGASATEAFFSETSISKKGRSNYGMFRQHTVKKGI